MKETHISDEILQHRWKGAGTSEDPYLVEFFPNDPENPMNFSQTKKWSLTFVAFLSVFNVTFLSSAYSGTINEIREEFHSSLEVTILGISLFVLGFAVGPAFCKYLGGAKFLIWGCLGRINYSLDHFLFLEQHSQ